jgi:hypothetical protein
LADSGSTDFALSDFLSLPDCRYCSFAATSTIDPIAVKSSTPACAAHRLATRLAIGRMREAGSPAMLRHREGR